MKKIIIALTLLISSITVAQKDEFKTLKKVYDRDTPSSKDLESYKNSIQTLSGMSLNESDKVSFDFYKGMMPLVELASLGKNAKPEDQMKLFSPEKLDNFIKAVNNTLRFEEKSDKKEFTADINETLSWFKPMLLNVAYQFNTSKNFKEGSQLFYKIYELDKNDGSNLENAAILSVQAQDYLLAEKLYTELNESDYLKNGKKYFALNKASGKEESFASREDMVKMIGIGSHETPRTVNNSEKKPEVLKILALVSSQNGNFENAKKYISEGLELSPNDADLKAEGARIYFNEAYEILKDDQQLVDEINSNLDKKAKYDELVAKRKANFTKALPSLEKSYALDSKNNNTISLLKVSYDILNMKDKAKTLE